MDRYAVLYALLILGLIVLRFLIEEVYVRKEREEVKREIVDLKAEVLATKKFIELMLGNKKEELNEDKKEDNQE